MKNPNTVWTPSVRRSLYEQLVNRFGAHSTWETPRSPGHGRDEAFDAFCTDYAKAIGAHSSGAVKMQILYGTPNGLTRRSNIQRGHMETYILNLAAAFEMDFIKGTDLVFPGWTEEVIAHRTPGGNELVFHP